MSWIHGAGTAEFLCQWEVAHCRSRNIKSGKGGLRRTKSHFKLRHMQCSIYTCAGETTNSEEWGRNNWDPLPLLPYVYSSSMKLYPGRNGLHTHMHISQQAFGASWPTLIRSSVILMVVVVFLGFVSWWYFLKWLVGTALASETEKWNVSVTFLSQLRRMALTIFTCGQNRKVHSASSCCCCCCYSGDWKSFCMPSRWPSSSMP